MALRSIEYVIERNRKGEEDVLADVFSAVRMRGAVFFDNEAHAPWVGQSPGVAEVAHLVMPEHEHVIPFHVVTAGSCWVELVDHPTPAVRLDEGDVVICAGGDQAVLSSSPGMRGEPHLDAYHRAANHRSPLAVVLNETAGPESCHFVCGFVGCDDRPFNPLLDALPRMFCARSTAGSRELLSNLIRAALAESEDRKAGSETMLAKVAELIFLEVIRGHIDELSQDSRGWLSGLKDRHVGAALRLIHGKPAEPWTLDRLAREIGVSRSGLAERFTHLVGVPPMQYLARWRLQLAARLLERPGINVSRAAIEVGYESEAAFRTAFRKRVGVPPGEWRRKRFAREGNRQTANA